MENEFDKRDVNRILIKQECLDENKQQEFPVATPSLLENGQRYVWNINKVNENTKQNLNKTKDAELIDYNNRDDCGDTKGNEKERLSCNVCDKTYTKASSLVVHYRLHTGDKPYSCSLCEKTFTYSSSLLFHNRTHTGEKPFSCNICGKSFSRLGHVKTHKLTHTSETPYTCDICKHKFKHKSSLMQNVRIGIYGLSDG
ncbi:unnamed protein product, partial [Leptidea sinapis]